MAVSIIHLKACYCGIIIVHITFWQAFYLRFIFVCNKISDIISFALLPGVLDRYYIHFLDKEHEV